MIAARDLKNATRIRIRAFFDILHPRPIDAERDMIFSLARDCASMTANTFAVIDDKPVFHRRYRPKIFSAIMLIVLSGVLRVLKDVLCVLCGFSPRPLRLKAFTRSGYKSIQPLQSPISDNQYPQ